MHTSDQVLLNQLQKKETRQARLDNMSPAELRKLHSLLLSGEVPVEWDESIKD